MSVFSLGASAQQQQPSNTFGATANQPKSSLFGSLNTGSTGTSVFGQPASTASTPFGPTSSAPATRKLADAPPLGSSQSQPQQGGSVFGTVPAQPQQQTPSLFGQPQNQATKPSVFGTTATANTGGGFGLGGNTNQQQLGGSVFGQPQSQQQQGTSIFGQPQNQQQQQQQQAQQPQQQAQQIGSSFGQSTQPRIWSEQEGQLRKPLLLLQFSPCITSTNLPSHRSKIRNRPNRTHLLKMEPPLP